MNRKCRIAYVPSAGIITAKRSSLKQNNLRRYEQDIIYLYLAHSFVTVYERRTDGSLTAKEHAIVALVSSSFRIEAQETREIKRSAILSVASVHGRLEAIHLRTQLDRYENQILL